MTRTEARKNIIKTNKLRKKIERLRDRLWHTSIGGKGFELCQNKLKAAEKEMTDGAEEHRDALKAFLAP